MLDFKPLALSSRGEYAKCLLASEERAADYSFINLWAWNHERCYETAFYEDLCWIRLTKNKPYELWAPLGAWGDVNWKDVLSNLFPGGAVFNRVPEKLALVLQEKLGDMTEVKEERSEWEYIYSADELINLSGNKFHKKKNLFKQFLKYSPVYEEMNPDNLNELKDFYERRIISGGVNSDGAMDEDTATIRILSDWDKFPGILGGMLRIDGKFVAYTVAEDFGDGTVIIHFEKGFHLDSYKGVYQGINQIFLANSGKFSLVNREQDMGLKGLRQAKMTYNPLGFLKKYIVKWNGK
ncbi:MAG: phosphatidylglycerol lysyltransferase domain-containing protein [Synergistaceae bacterium]|nr:phosphatidylglycerol lysyltransferase domain-containing protein [Synergistaceae bacterium]